MIPVRLTGSGWLALVGGGEFSFGDTLEADRAWLARAGEGPVGFVPAASGSRDYADNFVAYLDQAFGRPAELLPVYRRRDANRAKNCERIAQLPAVYLGGGVTEDLLETLAGSTAVAALAARRAAGGVVAAIAAAAQATGVACRGLTGRALLPGLGWLPGGVVEANFDPGHDRRLRQLLAHPGATWGLGIPAGAAVLLGPDGAFEAVGMSFLLDHPDGDLVPLTS